MNNTLTEEQRENLATFISELRSNNYTQTFRTLKEGECFCVQGVACDLFIKKTGKGDWELINQITKRYNFLIASYNSSTAMNQSVRDFFGITSQISSWMLFANDVKNLKFPEIADALENWLELGNENYFREI